MKPPCFSALETALNFRDEEVPDGGGLDGALKKTHTSQDECTPRNSLHARKEVQCVSAVPECANQLHHPRKIEGLKQSLCEVSTTACAGLVASGKATGCTRQEPMEVNWEPASEQGVLHTASTSSGDANTEPCPECFIDLENVAADDEEDSLQDRMGKELTPRSRITCSAGSAYGRSGHFTAAGETSVSLATISVLDACSLYEGCDLAIVASPGNIGCSVGVAFKRLAFWTAIGSWFTSLDETRHRRSCTSTVLHSVALLFCFVMLVSLWNILDKTVEALAGSSCLAQLKWYFLLLAAGIFMFFLLHLSESWGYACTLYAAPFASLPIIVAAWGIFDCLVEIAAGWSRHPEVLFYFLIFCGAAFLVFLHIYFCDRGFSMRLRRFVEY